MRLLPKRFCAVQQSRARVCSVSVVSHRDTEPDAVSKQGMEGADIANS